MRKSLRTTLGLLALPALALAAYQTGGERRGTERQETESRQSVSQVPRSSQYGRQNGEIEQHRRARFALGLCAGQILARNGVSIPTQPGGTKPPLDDSTQAALDSAVQECRNQMGGTAPAPTPAPTPAASPSGSPVPSASPASGTPSPYSGLGMSSSPSPGPSPGA